MKVKHKDDIIVVQPSPPLKRKNPERSYTLEMGVKLQEYVIILLLKRTPTMDLHDPHLVNVAPRFLLVQHALPQHAHNLGEMLVRERVSRYLLHERAVRAPRVIVCCLPNFCLHLRVVHHDIGATNTNK